MYEIVNEFKSLSFREKALTIFALIAFPGDIVVLIKLLWDIFQFQQVNPTERPSAIIIGLPKIVWDSRIIDAVLLTILLYSFGIFLTLLYRWNLRTIAKQQLLGEIKVLGGKKKYVKLHKRKPIPESEQISEDALTLAAVIACLWAFSIFLPLFAIWTRVFLVTPSTSFTIKLMVLLLLPLFTYLYLSDRRMPFQKQTYSKRFMDNFESGVMDLPSEIPEVFSSLLGIVWNSRSYWIIKLLQSPLYIIIWFLWIFIKPLMFDYKRSLKTIFKLGVLASVAFFPVYKEIGYSWLGVILSSLFTTMVIIPILWTFYIFLSLIVGSILTFLFTPLTYRKRTTC